VAGSNGRGEHSEALFSYGTLRLRDVQLATFGRQIESQDDALPGFRLDVLTITDPGVIATSGLAEHPILRRSDDPASAVPGSVMFITPAELAAADEYEVDDYARVSVTLASGLRAWVYVAPEQEASAQ
jgi:gamma-glutamylcyclotransferase (GGCT)/AIG2-like uncharacterized protein YtfP